MKPFEKAMTEEIKVDESAVVSKEIVYHLPIFNPVPVYDSMDEWLGSATVGLDKDGLKISVNIDKHRPEALDLEVNPEHLNVRLGGNISGGVLYLEIFVG